MSESKFRGEVIFYVKNALAIKSGYLRNCMRKRVMRCITNADGLTVSGKNINPLWVRLSKYNYGTFE